MKQRILSYRTPLCRSLRMFRCTTKLFMFNGMDSGEGGIIRSDRSCPLCTSGSLSVAEWYPRPPCASTLKVRKTTIR